MAHFARFGFIVFTLIAANTVAQSVPLPPTFLFSPALLKSNKERINQGNQQLITARQTVLAKADKALTGAIPSVMSKSRTPPSGDKHDYMSVGPYWWPDSTKANGLPYIRKDGQINPERYTIRDAEYLDEVCNNVELLAVAYYYSNNETYARRAAELLRSWFLNPATRMNPNLNYGQAIPGITDGRGIGLIDTRELAKAANAVQLLENAKAWSSADQAALQGWFRQFLDWMLHSPIGKDEEDEHNNHGTYYDVQSVAFALLLDDKTLAKQIIEQKTLKRIQSQLNEDGSQPHELARTLSWNYSIMNLKGFFILAQLAEAVQIDLWRYESPDGKSLKKAFLWLLPYADDQKLWPHQQIKARHPEDFWPLETIALATYTSSQLPAIANEAAHAEDSFFLLTHALL